ncbi:MAG: TolC family type secretion outer membrane protein [Proteobacteria bacterium]|nr:TolC family type secretion outer membrane protein [Pseudomonadota bacterium]
MLTMRYAFISSVIGLMLLAGRPAAAADLVDIYRQALASDPVYSAARASWQAAQEKLPQGLAGLLPQASLSASTQYNDRELQFRDPTIAFNRNQYNSNSASVSVTQPIYRKQNLVAYDQGKTQVALSDAQFAVAGQDLILRVSQAYFDVLLALANLSFTEAQKTAIGQQLEQAKRNFEVGNATITDTHEAQARYDLVTAQEIAARADVDVKNRVLEQLIGRPAPVLAPPAKNFAPIPPTPNAMEPWVERARTTGLAVRIAQENLTFFSQDVERNRGAHHPTVDAYATATTAGAGPTSPGTAGTDLNSSVIGLQLAIPIYQGGIVNSRVREALANEDKARQDLEDARRSAELLARQGYLGVTSSIAQVRALEAAVVSNQSSLDSTILGQQVGVRTQVDVLNAQQLLYSAQRDLAQARYNYIASLLRLIASSGELTEADLQRINSWLEK